MKKNNLPVACLFLLPIVVMLISCVLVSCKKDSSTNPSTASAQLLINNLSPDVYPVQFYVNNVIQNQLNTSASIATAQIFATYKYNTPSAYFSLKSPATMLQLRSTRTADSILITVPDSLVKVSKGHKYSLFVTGLLADRSLNFIFTKDDTSATSFPKVGNGKMRYINATLRTIVNGAPTGYDVYANGTLVFKNISYNTTTPSKSVSPYVEFPAGTYNLRFVYTGYSPDVSSNVLINLTNVTIQDGHLYTLYSSGISGKASTDTAAVAAAVITNQ